MSVAEIGQLHTRYVRLSDKFKAAWTWHQFASGVFKNFLQRDVPYAIDFQSIYEELKRAYDTIQSAASMSAGPMMDRSEVKLDAAISELLTADAFFSPSILRRFFEGLRRQDEKILFNVIKFYLYAQAPIDKTRDKLDFLFTRMGEDFVEERGEYSPKDTLELRRQFQSLVAVRPLTPVSQEEIVGVIRSIRSVRDRIQRMESFESLTQANLLNQAREAKEGLGDHLLHPDVLLAVVECNITAKNKFTRLYQEEEGRILEDARRLLDNEEKIAHSFGESNPDLMAELQRFKEVKQEFDDSRATRNVKYSVIAQLKSSMNNILAQLDRGLEPGADVEAISDEFLLEVQHADAVHGVFGDDRLLGPYLTKIVAALDGFPRDASPEAVAEEPAAARLRLEPWEIAAFQKIFPGAFVEPEPDDLLLLYLRAAALRLRIDEEAQRLSALPPGARPEGELLEGIKASLDRAKELDLQFKDFLQEGIGLSNSRNLHRLYRSRLRLLRGFSGLWLIYDLRASGS